MAIDDVVYPFLKHYTKAPQFVKSFGGTLYSWLPDRLRFGPEYARFLRDIELSQTSADIVGLAEQRLLETLTGALTTVPAYRPYRDLLSGNASATSILQALPLLEKESIKAAPESYLSDAMPPETHLVVYTGGSTSIPMRINLHKHVTRSKDIAYNGTFDRLAGITASDTILCLRGRSVPGAERPDGPIWMYDPIKRYLHLSSDHLEPQHMPKYMEALRRFKPTYIHAFPSAIVPIADWLNEHPDEQIQSRFRGVQLFSENIYDYQVEVLERAFRCPVLFDYGQAERTCKAISYANDKRYFFWPLYGKLELIDANGRPITEPGVLGEMVGTGFDNKVMPLVRYRTGDLAMWSGEPNPEHPGFAVVQRIEGRMQEFLVCKDRRIVSITTIGAAHFEELADADRMQFEQTVEGRATLKVLSKTELSEEVKRALAQGVASKTQGGLEIDVVRVSEIPRTVSGKHKLLIQKLDLSSYLGAVRQQDGE